MNPGALELTYLDLAISAVLILAAGGISIALRLKLEKQLALATVRTVLQLLLVGYLLKWIFDLDQFYLVLAAVFIMIGAASHAAIGRPARTFPGAYRQTFLTLILTGLLTTFLVTGVVIGTDPWWQPQYFIPLLGMILGNGLTGISLCLDHLLESLSQRGDQAEMELALGATAWEAARTPVREAVRRGMIPIINAMMVVGIVSLPGMMTGQILAGADPLQATKYQVVVMFMIAAATAASNILLAWLVYRRLFNTRHQLRRELIRKKT